MTTVDAPAEVAFADCQRLTESLLVRLARCSRARERLLLQQEVVLLNLGLADGIAMRYDGRGVDRDDLVQVGRMGLLKAVIRYRAELGAGFTAYASPTIAGEIKRYFRDHGWMVRPPRRLQELHNKLGRVEPDLQQQLRRAPSGDELARALQLKPGEYSDLLVARSGYRPLRLDALFHTESGWSLGDDLPEPSDPYHEVEQAELLRPALVRLTDRERLIVRLRFADDLTYEQMGHQLGVSPMQVSRLLTGILARLRDDLRTSEVVAIS